MKCNLLRIVSFAGASLTLGAACSSAPPARGELMLAITTDMAAGEDFDRLQIEIRQEGAPTIQRTFQEFGRPGQEAHFPATFSIVANDRPETKIQLRIITGKMAPGGNLDVGIPANLYEVVTSVPKNRIAVLPVRLEWLCKHSTKLEPDGYVEGTCHEGSTCVAGECTDWNVEADALATFSERDIFGGGTSRGDGACFDTVQCFSGARAVTLDADCSVAFADLNANSDSLNLALVPPEGQGGICGTGTCFVPLDRDAVHGWTEQDGRVQLPKKVCELLLSTNPEFRLRGVVASSRCPSKVTGLPTCGPWSTITGNRGASSSDPVEGL